MFASLPTSLLSDFAHFSLRPLPAFLSPYLYQRGNITFVDLFRLVSLLELHNDTQLELIFVEKSKQSTFSLQIFLKDSK